MKIAVSFLYKNKNYVRVLAEQEQFTVGSHKYDTIMIPELGAHALAFAANGGNLQVTARPPFSFPAGPAAPNKIHPLDSSRSSAFYASVLTGRSSQEYPLPFQGTVTVGRSSENDIVLPFPVVSGKHLRIRCGNGQFTVEDLGSTNSTFLNGSLIHTGKLHSGDILSILTFQIILKNGVLYFENMGNSIHMKQKVSYVPKDLTPHTPAAGPPVFQRSPRLREQLPQLPVVLSSAPSLGGAAVGGGMNPAMFLASSAAMIASSMAMGGLSPAFLLARSAGMIPSVVNMFMSKSMAKKQKEEFEAYQKMCRERYEGYIEEQKARIGQIADIQRQIVTSENPSPVECIDTVKNIQRRLWERMQSDSDFLQVRIGMGYEKLCVDVKTRADLEGFHIVSDETEELAGQIIEETRFVDRVPVRISLMKYPVIGIVGSRSQVVDEARNMLITLTAEHSPLDVKLAGIFEKAEQPQWAALRWLPHIWDDAGQFRYIAFDPDRIHALCEILDDMIRKRGADLSSQEHAAQAKAFPHFVLVIANPKLLQNEPIYDRLVRMSASYGITTLILAETYYDLPPECRYMIDLTSDPCAYERDIYNERVYFTPDAHISRAEMDSYARRMAAIELAKNSAGTPIPSSITFLQGFGAASPADLDIPHRWQSKHRSFAVPVGMMANNRPLFLDILPQANGGHGPHGIVAGTTGSGKSEFLQSWILSMAVNFHPHDLNFVIIDFKGGGMASLLEPLPHVTGMVTNLDTDISRIRASLFGEISRRETLFKEIGVNGFEKYQAAYDAGMTQVKLPRLVVVVDEFAELKKEEPDFMAGLISFAQVGRSLGINMILSTQKPGGVIDDKINANTTFRICFKVQDISDSREMLRHPDAARITQSGRGYVRVGEDEIYEQFQSFYSGAAYQEGSKVVESHENLVRIVDVNGQKLNLLPSVKKDKGQTQDELTAVMAHIRTICQHFDIQKLPGPWLPELPGWITVETLFPENAFHAGLWPRQENYLCLPVGKYDAPSSQKQGTLFFDFEKTGHFAVYGTPSSGKTTLLETLIYAASRLYSPGDLKIHILDFNSWRLREFQELPHIESIIRNDEEDRIALYAAKMASELERRKQLFLQHNVTSLSAYRSSISEDLPAILLVMDNILPAFGQMPELEELLYLIVANGASYGVHLIFTANMTSGIHYKFLQQIKGACALELTDRGDYASIVGKLEGAHLPSRVGQGLFRANPALAFQTAVMLDEKEDHKRKDLLSEKIQEMKEAWGEEPASPFVFAEAPETPAASEKAPDFLWNHLCLQKSAGTPQLTLGQNADGQTISCDLSSHYGLALLASNSHSLNEACLNFSKRIAPTPGVKTWLFLSDPGFTSTSSFRGATPQLLHISQLSAAEDAITQLAQEMNRRAMLHGMGTSLEEEDTLLLLLDDLSAWSSALSEASRKMLWSILKKAGGLHVAVIAGLAAGAAAEADDMLTRALLDQQQALLLDGTAASWPQIQTDLTPSEQGTELLPDRILWVREGHTETVFSAL